MADPMFTWTTTHKELVEYLSKNRKQQKKLVDVLRKAGVTSLIDKLRRCRIRRKLATETDGNWPVSDRLSESVPSIDRNPNETGH